MAWMTSGFSSETKEARRSGGKKVPSKAESTINLEFHPVKTLFPNESEI